MFWGGRGLDDSRDDLFFAVCMMKQVIGWGVGGAPGLNQKISKTNKENKRLKKRGLFSDEQLKGPASGKGGSDGKKQEIPGPGVAKDNPAYQ